MPDGVRTLSRRQLLSMAATLPMTSAPHHPDLPEPSGPVVGYDRRMFPEKGSIDGVRHWVWTKAPSSGSGPQRHVILLHEITGATRRFFQLADMLVADGFTVHCPVLFGGAPVGEGFLRTAIAFLQACNAFAEFECVKRSARSQINEWLVALGADVATRHNAKVGAIGMCLTGIQPLAMLRAKGVVAPVLCQPTLPLMPDEKSKLDFALPPSDMDYALTRVKAENLKVLMLRYEGDPTAPRLKAERIARLFGEQYLDFHQITGNHHSSLGRHRDDAAYKHVVTFLNERLS